MNKAFRRHLGSLEASWSQKVMILFPFANSHGFLYVRTYVCFCAVVRTFTTVSYYFAVSLDFRRTHRHRVGRYGRTDDGQTSPTSDSSHERRTSFR
jgi:hypothetical protein